MPPQKNLIDYYADRLEESFNNSAKIGNRVATFDIAAFKNVIFKIAQSSGLPGSYGGAQDAFRHIVLAGESTRLLGKTMGRISVNLREQATLILPWESKHGVMDVHNNDIGIEIGLNAKNLNEVVELARKKMAEAKSFDGDGGLNKDGSKRVVWMEKSRTNLWPSDWKKRKIPTYPMGEKDQTHPYNKPEKPSPPDDPIGGSDASADAGSEEAAGKFVDVAASDVKAKSVSNQPAKEHSPEAKKMLAGLRTAKDTPSEILAKPVYQVTEDEVGEVIGSPPYWQSDVPLHKESQGLVRGVMEHAWGTGPVITDATGRPTDSAPINPYQPPCGHSTAARSWMARFASARSSPTGRAIRGWVSP